MQNALQNDKLKKKTSSFRFDDYDQERLRLSKEKMRVSSDIDVIRHLLILYVGGSLSGAPTAQPSPIIETTVCTETHFSPEDKEYFNKFITRDKMTPEWLMHDMMECYREFDPEFNTKVSSDGTKELTLEEKDREWEKPTIVDSGKEQRMKIIEKLKGVVKVAEAKHTLGSEGSSDLSPGESVPNEPVPASPEDLAKVEVPYNFGGSSDGVDPEPVY